MEAEREERSPAWKTARAAFALFILAAIGALMMPDAWIAFSKFTVQERVWPLNDSFGCLPDEQPCCLEGYNTSAMTDKWETWRPQVICRYFRYPIRELFVITATILLVITVVAYMYDTHGPGRGGNGGGRGISGPGASSSGAAPSSRGSP